MAAMKPRRDLPLLCLLALASAWGTGCSSSVAVFEVRQSDPGPGGCVALNQELCLAFSHYLESSSVNEQTLRVLDAAGRPVPGRFRVEGKLVFFQPRPPLLPDLSDGGFKPGGRYALELPGFPLLHTVRTRGFEAQTLARGFGLSFQATTGAPGEPPLLLDAASPRLGPFPVLVQREAAGLWLLEVPPGANPLIRFSESLDPRQVGPPGPFLLATLEGRRIEVCDLRLAHQGLGPEELGRVVEVVPAEPLRPGEAYRLELFPGPWLPDCAGNPLQVAPGDGPSTPILLRVEPRRGEEFFTDASGATEETQPDQAWAWWGGGAFTACLLDAAGEGDLGPLEPRRDLVLVPGARVDLGDGRSFVCPGRDLHFTRIGIPKGVTLTLAAGGPWILRSQGPCAIEGNLRVVGRRPSSAPHGGTYIDPAGLIESRAERLQGGGLIVVASGNLSLEGRIDFPGGGGALLVSGGQVLVGPAAGLGEGWLECADRRPPFRPVDFAGAALVTSLLPAGQAGGWVSEPLAVAAVSTFRALPPGEGALRVPVLHMVPPGEEATVQLQGAPADPFQPDRPDLARLTPWYAPTNAGALGHCAFFRFRVQIVVPPGKGAPVPKVTAFRLERG